MGTPSEVLAGKILERIGFEKVKFVNSHYDFEAERKGRPAIIEAKHEILSLVQMETLAEKFSKGIDVYLIVTSLDGHFCLFQLVSTDLELPPPPRKRRKKNKHYLKFWSDGVEVYCPRYRKWIPMEMVTLGLYQEAEKK